MLVASSRAEANVLTLISGLLSVLSTEAVAADEALELLLDDDC